MTSVILYLLLRDDKAEAAFARFHTVMKSMPNYEVQVDGSDHRHTKITADLVIQGRKKLLFDAKLPAGHVVFTIGDDGYREVNYPTRTYDELAFKGGVRPVASRISAVPRTIPFWMFSGNLHEAMPKDSHPEALGKRMVNGQECDHIKASFKNSMAEGFIEFDIATSGLIYRLFQSTNSAKGHEEFEWTFRDYRPLRTVVASRFDNRVPDGFMPFTFPSHPYPPQIGQKLPLSGWVNASTGKPWTLTAKSATLVLLASKDSSPSKRALATTPKWRSELKSKGVDLAIAVDSSNLARSEGFLYNLAGKGADSLGAPATPMFYLLDRKGNIKNLWLGFGPSQVSEIHSEILKAVSGLK